MRTAPAKPTIKRAKSSDAKRGAAVRKSQNTGTMAAAASVSPDKPLTTQQKAFVKAWAEGDSIPNALARAGYSIKDHSLGYRMAKMPNILALYEQEKRLYEEASQMTRKRVMDGLLDAVDMARLMSEPATMVSGWREIGRMCGYFEPKKVQIDVNVSGSIIHERINSLSDAELLKIIQSPDVTPLLGAPSGPSEANYGDD